VEEAMASIAASAPEDTVQTVAVPMPDINRANEDAVNELLDKNLEYQRLTSEEHREQYRNAARATLERKQNQAEIRETSIAAAQANRQAELIQREQQLKQRATEILAAIPSELANDPRFTSLPLEDQIKRMPSHLAGDYIKTLQEFDQLFQATGRPSWEELQSAPQPVLPTPQPQPNVQPQPAPQLNQQPEPTQQSSIADYWAAQQAEALAKRFGFSNESELVQWGARATQAMEIIENQNIVGEFMQKQPDFPNSAEANNALTAIIEANNWQYNADSLQAAHLLAVQRHLYQPLSPEEQQASVGAAPQTSRPTPPPMVRSQNPEQFASPQLAPEQMTNAQAAQWAKAEYFRLLNEQKAGSYR
jgi:hypothetical protein